MPDDITIDLTFDLEEAVALEQQAKELHLFSEEYCHLLIARQLSSSIPN